MSNYTLVIANSTEQDIRYVADALRVTVHSIESGQGYFEGTLEPCHVVSFTPTVYNRTSRDTQAQGFAVSLADYAGESSALLTRAATHSEAGDIATAVYRVRREDTTLRSTLRHWDAYTLQQGTAWRLIPDITGDTLAWLCFENDRVSSLRAEY